MLRACRAFDTLHLDDLLQHSVSIKKYVTQENVVMSGHYMEIVQKGAMVSVYATTVTMVVLEGYTKFILY